MLLDLHTLDLRLPETRRQDEIGVRAFSVLRRTLWMENLLNYRRQALGLKGTWPPEGLEPAMTVTVARLETLVHQHDEPSVMFRLTEQAGKSPLYWDAEFTIRDVDVRTSRRVHRLERALGELVYEVNHLSNLRVTVESSYITVTLKVAIGELTPPPTV